MEVYVMIFRGDHMVEHIWDELGVVPEVALLADGIPTGEAHPTDKRMTGFGSLPSAKEGPGKKNTSSI
jgi:hypothetical protein